ncbi:MAG: hypothetical protein WC476_01690 [Phycisphaerae bacterium]
MRQNGKEVCKFVVIAGITKLEVSESNQTGQLAGHLTVLEPV